MLTIGDDDTKRVCDQLVTMIWFSGFVSPADAGPHLLGMVGCLWLHFDKLTIQPVRASSVHGLQSVYSIILMLKVPPPLPIQKK